MNQFIGDRENALIQVLVAAFLSDRPEYLPLVIAGAQDTGKSFLAAGLAARWNEEHRDRPAIAFSGQEFAQSFADALETDSIKSFRARLIRAGAVVIDGLEQLLDKLPAQLELTRFLDLVSREQQRVLITCRRQPDWPPFHAALTSRLHGGLIVPLEPPGNAARQTILRLLLRRANVRIDTDALEWLSRHDGADPASRPLVPQLAHLVSELATELSEARQPWSTELLQARSPTSNLNSEVQPRDIVRAVCDNFGITMAELKGPSRRRQVVRARGLAVYLARRLTSTSLENLGRLLGGRDHTTTMHACRATQTRMASDAGLQQAAASITHRVLAAARNSP